MADRPAKPLSSLPGLRSVCGNALPTAEAVGYFRESLTGPGGGPQVSRAMSLYALTRIVGDAHSKSPW